MIRYILQRRWLPWHVLWLIAVAGCVWLGMWQLQAAMAPQPVGADTQVWRNYAYALNWLVFAFVALWFWWRFMRDQRAVEAAEHVADPKVLAGDAPTAPLAASPAQGTRVAPGGQQRFDPFAATEPHQRESTKSSGGSV